MQRNITVSNKLIILNAVASSWELLRKNLTKRVTAWNIKCPIFCLITELGRIGHETLKARTGQAFKEISKCTLKTFIMMAIVITISEWMDDSWGNQYNGRQRVLTNAILMSDGAVCGIDWLPYNTASNMTKTPCSTDQRQPPTTHTPHTAQILTLYIPPLFTALKLEMVTVPFTFTTVTSG